PARGRRADRGGGGRRPSWDPFAFGSALYRMRRAENSPIRKVPRKAGRLRGRQEAEGSGLPVNVPIVGNASRADARVRESPPFPPSGAILRRGVDAQGGRQDRRLFHLLLQARRKGGVLGAERGRERFQLLPKPTLPHPGEPVPLGAVVVAFDVVVRVVDAVLP